MREDDKIDVSLQPLGYDKVEGIAQQILRALEQNNGTLPLHDKSDADEIYALLGCSKKSFKKAIGSLYKQQLITLGENEITQKGMKSESPPDSDNILDDIFVRDDIAGTS